MTVSSVAAGRVRRPMTTTAEQNDLEAAGIRRSALDTTEAFSGATLETTSAEGLKPARLALDVRRVDIELQVLTGPGLVHPMQKQLRS